MQAAYRIHILEESPVEQTPLLSMRHNICAKYGRIYSARAQIVEYSVSAVCQCDLPALKTWSVMVQMQPKQTILTTGTDKEPVCWQVHGSLGVPLLIV